jgi:hypothetical protein
MEFSAQPIGTAADRSRRAIVVAVAVILLHVMLWLFLRGPRVSRVIPARATTTLILLPAVPVERDPAPRPPSVAVRREKIAVLPRRAINVPPVTASSGSPAAVVPEPAPASSPEKKPEPLNLTLQPGVSASIRSTNPALGQGRLESVRQSLAERLAGSLKPGDEMTFRVISPGRILVRKGDACYEMIESRAAQLDPYAGIAPLHQVNCGN